MEKIRQTPSKKRLLLLVFLAAAVLLTAILLRGFFGRGPDLDTTDGRVGYLRSLGWEVDPASEEQRGVRIPKELDEVLTKYNELQQDRGWDLSAHLGEKCQQYSYTVLNYPDTDDTVRLTLYLKDGKLIAADLHSTAFDGFMHGLVPRDTL